MSIDETPLANRNETQTFGVSINLKINLFQGGARQFWEVFFWARRDGAAFFSVGLGSKELPFCPNPGLNLYFLPPKAQETKPTKV